MRVLFQMSPTDSGHMLDTPAASKLGGHRALFHSEEQNRLEKFRPYGIPSEKWLRRQWADQATFIAEVKIQKLLDVICIDTLRDE